MCSDLCLLKPGGYQCTCPSGIVLKEDGKNCDFGEVTYSTFQPYEGGEGGFVIIDRAYQELVLDSRGEGEISFPNFEKK